jgi:hypothetical protein
MDKLEFESKKKEIQRIANALMETNRKWREGQCIFNAAYAILPDELNKIRGSRYDPFHINERIPLFWEYLESMLVDGGASNERRSK